ncbi:MAG: T9SS type A sorting domain-containing protein [Ignavibacteria bacterium]|nr:T9SS type A sorting domain-containing protein [Ignavibacteria bacterium]
MQDVKLVVYDVLGSEVVTLINESKTVGSYEVEFDATGFPSGIYFYSLLIDGNVIDTKRMILLK